MKNREKFRDQILEWAVAPGRDICDFRRKEVLAYFGKGCGGISCSWCGTMFDLWLDEEYEEPPKPKVDWSKVPVDTLVMVRDNEDDEWVLRYFDSFEEESFSSMAGHNYMVFADGATSVTGRGCVEHWKYCELVEDEDNDK